MGMAVLAVAVGGGVGALARWMLSYQLNAYFPAIPPGTLAANIIGGYIVGFAIAFFASRPEIAPEWRLLIITGFCGGLTTFSTFSAEVVMLIQQGEISKMAIAITLHLAGSLAATILGIASWTWMTAR
ncbi:MAG TPA: fluoride efflux transporter CrcB [Usitatibacter sp.]|jgi:CrcB protein|nr:fluoride efflux transporter CrcB [Usitatibacter sp.]HSW84336.1 fluoride efflux transporter CrcB [Usitatibacter sp.]